MAAAAREALGDGSAACRACGFRVRWRSCMPVRRVLARTDAGSERCGVGVEIFPLRRQFAGVRRCEHEAGRNCLHPRFKRRRRGQTAKRVIDLDDIQPARVVLEKLVRRQLWRYPHRIRGVMNLAEVRRLTIVALVSDDRLFEQIVLKGGNALSLVYGLSSRTSLALLPTVSSPSAYSAPSGVSSCLKNKYRSFPCASSSLARLAISARSSGEYSGFRSR